MVLLPELYQVEFVILSIMTNMLFSTLTLLFLHRVEDCKGKGAVFGYLAVLSFSIGGWLLHLLQARSLFAIPFSQLFNENLMNSLLALFLCLMTTLLFYIFLGVWERSNTSVFIGAIIFSLGMGMVYLSGVPIMRIKAIIYFDPVPCILAYIACLVCSYIVLRYFKGKRNTAGAYAGHFLIDAVAVGVIISFIQFVGAGVLDFYVEPSDAVMIGNDDHSLIRNSTVIIFISILLIMVFLAYFDKYKAVMESSMQEEHYFALFHNSPSMLCMVNVHGDITDANIPFLNNTGLQRITFPKKASSLFKEPEEVEQSLAQSLKGERLRFQAVMKIKGREITVMVTHIPVKTRSIISGIIMDLQDITELESTKKEALGRVHLQETIFSTFSEGLFVHDLDGKTIEVNRRAAELLGVPFTEVYTINPFHLNWDFITEGGEAIDNGDLPSVRAILTETTQTNYTLGIRKNQRDIQWLSVNASPLYLYEDLTGVVVTFTDVTSEITKTFQLKEANTELKKTIATVQEENKAKSEFLSRMSHELRTPLNSIIGYSELILENYERKHEVTLADIQKVRKIFRAGEHLQQMIDEVLDVTRLEYNQVEIRREPTDLLDALNGAIDIVTPHAQKQNVAIHLSMDDHQGYVIGDGLFLRQVFVNLLDNAVKYNKQYGHVYVTTKVIEDEAIISIKDEGEGIDTEHLTRIFDPFYRISSTNVKGTGIGLSVVKQTVELMGGASGVNSERSIGSTFWISVPLEGEVSEKVSSTT